MRNAFNFSKSIFRRKKKSGRREFIDIHGAPYGTNDWGGFFQTPISQSQLAMAIMFNTGASMCQPNGQRLFYFIMNSAIDTCLLYGVQAYFREELYNKASKRSIQNAVIDKSGFHSKTPEAAAILTDVYNRVNIPLVKSTQLVCALGLMHAGLKYFLQNKPIGIALSQFSVILGFAMIPLWYRHAAHKLSNNEWTATYSPPKPCNDISEKPPVPQKSHGTSIARTGTIFRCTL